MNNYKFKASIIIRGKNESRWLKILFKELKKQSLKNFEIIFCDNGSQDNTRDILKFYKIKKIITLKNYKPGMALNKSLKVASGEYIVFLSSHCIPAHKNWLKNLINFMEKNNQISAAYGKQIPLPGSNSQNALDMSILFRNEDVIHKRDPYISNANSIYRSKIIKKFKFNRNINNIEDRIWANAEIKRGGFIGYTAKSPVYHLHGVHQHLDSTNRSTNTIKILNKDFQLYWKKCQFLKINYFSYILIINARREKNRDKLLKKLKTLSSNSYLKKLDIKKIFVITDLKIKFKKNINKIVSTSSLKKDLNYMYKKYIKKEIDINYAISLNTTSKWDFKKVFSLISETIYLSKPSGVFFEKYTGNFIIEFPKNNELNSFKSVELIEKSHKPKIKLMKWAEGCLFDIDYMREGKYIDDESYLKEK